MSGARVWLRSSAAAIGSGALSNGCGARGSALKPAGLQAARIFELFSLQVGISVAIYAAVILALAAALVRARRSHADRLADLAEAPEQRRRLAIGVGAATALTLITLFGLLVASVATGRALASLESDDRLTVEVIGYQWWWQVNYIDPQPQLRFTTANEIHIPAGRPVKFRLMSRDVIHSFWVPELHGKRDMIPGYHNEIVLRADRPGIYRGRCAEFCGYQHAHMGLVVVAEPKAQFDAWCQQQRLPASPPQTPQQRAGEQVFLSRSCVLCHAIGGSTAGSNNGPDLTHLLSRRTLAAGTLANTRANLEAWIVDPQHAKPGNNMPPNRLEHDELSALLAYLETLR